MMVIVCCLLTALVFIAAVLIDPLADEVDE